ncbi:MAG: alkylhydroperoxidase [Micavibrio sp.]|nr:alkylhydroperoxidase [Micavibrio sp.]
MSKAPRLPWSTLAPKALQAMISLNGSLSESQLGKRLIDLVFTRVSQLNGCAYCVDSHVRDLRADGEEWQRINSLITWREVSLYSDRERAALNWSETMTRLADNHIDRDADFALLQKHFNDKEIVELTVAIAAMNAWNRLGVGMHLPVDEKPIE